MIAAVCLVIGFGLWLIRKRPTPTSEMVQKEELRARVLARLNQDVR